ncbi:MAG: hypothetical protein AB1405_15345 [Bdellovibrionota bacterium]
MPRTLLIPSLLALLFTVSCGDGARPLTDAFDGTWNLTLSGDCGGGPTAVEITDGIAEGTFAFSSGTCGTETGDLSGPVHPGAGESAAFPDFGDLRWTLQGEAGTFQFYGTITLSGGSGSWISSDGEIEGSFTLLP